MLFARFMQYAWPETLFKCQHGAPATRSTHLLLLTAAAAAAAQPPMGCGASTQGPPLAAHLEAATAASLGTAPNSEAHWYYSTSDKQQHGPCTFAELQAVIATGDDVARLAWRPGWSQWTSPSLIPELSTGAAASSSAAGPESSTTFSWAYVPFLHAVLQTDDASMVEYAAKLALRDEQWDDLVREYRARMEIISPEVLTPGHVAETNHDHTLQPWPHIPAAPECDEPLDPSTQSWPMRSSGPRGGALHVHGNTSTDGGVGIDTIGGCGVGSEGGGDGVGRFYTQEGLLSCVQPILFAKLQEMVKRIEIHDAFRNV